MLTVTNLNGQTEGLTDYKNLRVRERVNDEHSLSFTLFATDRNEHSYPLVQEESILEYEGQEYRIKKLKERSKGKKYYKVVNALHVFFDLIEEFQYGITGGSKTLHDLLSFALNGTDFTFEIKGDFPTKLVFNFGEANALILVQQALEVFEAEVELNNRHLIFKKQIGRKTDFQFRYKHNIKAISKDVDTTKLSTVIKGYGQGFEITYKSPNVLKYGERHAAPIRDDRYTHSESLLELLKQKLNDEPNVSITIEFAVLKEAGFPHEEVNVGDEVFLIYEPLGIDLMARVLDYNRHPEDLLKSEVTLSNYRESIVDIMSLMSNELQDVQKKNEINRSEIRQTNEKIELEVINLVGEIEQNRSLITQTAHEISLEVSKKVGNNEIISRINMSPEAIKIQASKVELTGYVTITSLSTPGQTTIDGGNITTGTIHADRLSTQIALVNHELSIGAHHSDTGRKIIRFRGITGAVNIESPANTSDLNIGALGTMRLSAGNQVILSGNVNFSSANVTGLSAASSGAHNHSLTDGHQVRMRNPSTGTEYWATFSSAPNHIHTVS